MTTIGDPAATANGESIIKIGRKGKRTFVLGEDGKPFTIDVVAVYYDYLDLDKNFRDDKGVVPDDRIGPLNKAAWDYVKDVAGTGGGDASDCTLAEALEFLATLRKEYDKLKSFFEIDSPEESSSPTPSETLRFST